MTIDRTKFRVGDRVTLHEAEITDLVDTCPLSIKVKFPSGQEDWFGVAEIATHTPKPIEPIKVGDWVKIPHNAAPFLVVAIDDDTAWIKNRHGRTWGSLVTLTPCEAPHDH